MFRHKTRNAHAYIDTTEFPFYIFTIILDRELIEAFSDEVAIKTDFNKVLPKKDDYKEGLVALRQAIFNAIRNTAPFKELKTKMAIA